MGQRGPAAKAGVSLPQGGGAGSGGRGPPVEVGPWGAVYAPPGTVLGGTSASVCPTSGAIAVEDGEPQGTEEPRRESRRLFCDMYQVDDVLKEVVKYNKAYQVEDKLKDKIEVGKAYQGDLEVEVVEIGSAKVRRVRQGKGRVRQARKGEGSASFAGRWSCLASLGRRSPFSATSKKVGSVSSKKRSRSASSRKKRSISARFARTSRPQSASPGRRSPFSATSKKVRSISSKTRSRSGMRSASAKERASSAGKRATANDQSEGEVQSEASSLHRRGARTPPDAEDSIKENRQVQRSQVEAAARGLALRAKVHARFMGASGQCGWQCAMKSCAESCQTVVDFGSALRAGAEHPPSRVAAVAAALTGAHALGTSPGLRGGGVLPLAPLAAEAYFADTARAVGMAFGPGFVDWCVAIVHAVNFLFCAGRSRKPVCTRARDGVSEAQKKVLDHISTSVQYTFEGPLDVFSAAEVQKDLDSRRRGYGGDVVSKRRDLVCDLVAPAWPSAEHAGALAIESFVKGKLREDLLDFKRCLLPASEWPAVTPRSKVHASDDEWYRLVQVGLERGIFAEVPESTILRDRHGELVLNGAMGVDKWKTVGGVKKRFLRFITILVPSNAFLRRLRGGSGDLPYLGQLSLVELGPEEDLWIDSEDMESCFNLFRMPPCWLGAFAFSKKVPRSVVGGPADEYMYVSIQTVPMGWIGAVDVMQYMARALVFDTCGIDPATELHKDRPLPSGPDITIVCMDGIDHVRKASAVLRCAGGPAESEGHRRFVETCARLRLPLNAGKRLLRASHGVLLGGELDGLRGWLSHARSKAEALVAKAVVLLGTALWTDGALQHWIGSFCFGASFRRPLFAVLEEVFTFAAAIEHSAGQPGPQHLDEVMCAAILAPLMYTNLRAPLRLPISCSDASEAGGGAAEAVSFIAALDPGAEEAAEALVAERVEESAFTEVEVRTLRCAACGVQAPVLTGAACALGCRAWGCSLACLLRHMAGCVEQPAVGSFVEKGLRQQASELTWAVARKGVHVLEPSLGAEGPEATWVHCVCGPIAYEEAIRYKARDFRVRKLAIAVLRRFERQLLDGKSASILGVEGCGLWYLSLARTLSRLPAVFCNEIVIDNVPCRLTHCSRFLNCDLLEVWTTSRGELLERIAGAVREEFDKVQAKIIPSAPSLRAEWVRQSLSASTAKLARVACNSQVVGEILLQLRSMRRGRESEHLRWLLSHGDYRGSDVQLLSGELIDGCRQELPYPAGAWDWRTVQAYPWHQRQHINVLEFTAFFTYLRSLAESTGFHGKRYFHIFDSRVVACVVAKGRSSSQVLNRCCRRHLALAIATDSYVLTLWTISQWNFADAASRLHDGRRG